MKKLYSGIVASLFLFMLFPQFASAYTIRESDEEQHAYGWGKIGLYNPEDFQVGYISTPYTKKVYTFTQADCAPGYQLMGGTNKVEEYIYNQTGTFKATKLFGHYISTSVWESWSPITPSHQEIIKQGGVPDYIFVTQGSSSFQEVPYRITPVYLESQMQLTGSFDDDPSMAIVNDADTMALILGTNNVTTESEPICSR